MTPRSCGSSFEILVRAAAKYAKTASSGIAARAQAAHSDGKGKSMRRTLSNAALDEGIIVEAVRKMIETHLEPWPATSKSYRSTRRAPPCPPPPPPPPVCAVSHLSASACARACAVPFDMGLHRGSMSRVEAFGRLRRVFRDHSTATGNGDIATAGVAPTRSYDDARRSDRRTTQRSSRERDHSLDEIDLTACSRHAASTRQRKTCRRGCRDAAGARTQTAHNMRRRSWSQLRGATTCSSGRGICLKFSCDRC